MAGSVAQRLAIHGIKVEPAPGGVFVPLRQRLRGLIAPILDSQAVLPMLTTAERRFCFREDLPVGGNVPATLSLTLGTAGDVRRRSRRAWSATTRRRRRANVISTAGDATLSVADPATTNTGKLVNGTFALAQTLQAQGQRRHVRAGRRLRQPDVAADLPGPGLQRLGDAGLQADDRAQRAAAYRHVRQDAHVHAEHDEPVDRGGRPARARRPPSTRRSDHGHPPSTSPRGRRRCRGRPTSGSRAARAWRSPCRRSRASWTPRAPGRGRAR